LQTARRGKNLKTDSSRPIDAVVAALIGSPEKKKKELNKWNIK